MGVALGCLTMRPSPLKLHRLAAGLDQGTLGARVGITRQLVHRLETGQTEPRLDLARRLALALETDLNTLFPMVLGEEQPCPQ